eukprot:scaffold210185_cov43-Prasinocladus_malaysianus.AAC.2
MEVRLPAEEEDASEAEAEGQEQQEAHQRDAGLDDVANALLQEGDEFHIYGDDDDDEGDENEDADEGDGFGAMDFGLGGWEGDRGSFMSMNPRAAHQSEEEEEEEEDINTEH